MPHNLIVIVTDTFRADHLGCCGNEWIRTPCLDRLAAEGTLFTNCFADGLPTIPARRVFFTGNSIIPERVHGGWQPLRAGDVTLAEVLGPRGFTTGFVTDTYHYFAPGMNFHRGFHSWQWVRGQENDRWRSGPRDEVNVREHFPEHLWSEGAEVRSMQYLLNTREMRQEEDYFCAQTFREAAAWLERSRRQQPFMLWVDAFDPHEPWDAPERFQKMYRDSYPVKRFIFDYGFDTKLLRRGDLPVLKALYAAEVSFVDMWIGHFLERVRSLGLLDETIVVFSSDHGTHIGEGGCVRKTPGLLNSCVARLPLIVRHPDRSTAGRRVGALVSAADFAPTFLAMLGVQDGPPMDGRDFWPLAAGRAEAIHERVFTEFGGFAAVRDRRWHYFQHTRPGERGRGPALYDLKRDPAETRNVVRDHPRVVAGMRRHLEERLGAPLP